MTFPVQQKCWIGFINRKSIVKLYHMWRPQQSIPIDLPEKVDWKIEWKNHIVWAHLNTSNYNCFVCRGPKRSVH